MTFHHFQQLKQFLHISPVHTTEEHWYSKLEPLSSKLSTDFSCFYIPSTDVSIDEMIVRFSRHSTHTIKMKNKPTPEGFKIYALCKSGYTFFFLYYSRVKSVIRVTPIEGLCNLQIGACGTVRISSKQFPPALKVNKKCKFEWDTLSGAVVDNTVLAVVWVDNAPVPMLSTIHQITGEESHITRLRF
ncbi:hypothetical protein CPB97_000585 [Podila verticillata]|nr:hypothetical protein CPB97_000585 [Podila verticillata]